MSSSVSKSTGGYDIIPDLKGGNNAPDIVHISAFFQTNSFDRVKEIYVASPDFKKTLTDYNIQFPDDEYDVDSFLLDLKCNQEVSEKVLRALHSTSRTPNKAKYNVNNVTQTVLTKSIVGNNVTQTASKTNSIVLIVPKGLNRSVLADGSIKSVINGFLIDLLVKLLGVLTVRLEVGNVIKLVAELKPSLNGPYKMSLGSVNEPWVLQRI